MVTKIVLYCQMTEAGYFTLTSRLAQNNWISSERDQLR